MAEFTGHTAGLECGDVVETPGGFGTVAEMEGEQVTGVFNHNGLTFSYHRSRVELTMKASPKQPAAPSLLARAEAAEERVRVLEAAVLAKTNELALIAATLNGIHAINTLPGAVLEALRIAEAALATTGVQHG